MEPIFPGMDPYLEQSGIWADVHHRMITAICDQILGRLSEKYTAIITPYVAFESLEISPVRVGMAVPDVGVTLMGLPDTGGVAVMIEDPPLMMKAHMPVPTEYGRVEIRTVDNETLVTSIELLSPANKRPGADGAEAYEKKRGEFFNSMTHLLEIDLLRAGQRPQLSQRKQKLPPDPYFVFLSRAGMRPFIAVWPIGLRRALPVVPVPLLRPDPDVPLDLNAALRQIYAAARYERRINYREDPPPPDFSADDLAWIDALLRERGMRNGSQG